MVLITPAVQAINRLDSAMLARKQIQAIRISTPPRIDGELNEPFWSTLPVGTNFVEYSPRNGILPPFEVRYDEKRQFFTEITELFEKCGIFYTPSHLPIAED
ncbi:MAG: hypothetical protein D4R67_01330 [Bacteroidetes bacterium]|nr:MAG: hypothetical protein D4R67_01330 [Bacteroidota bacterium]